MDGKKKKNRKKKGHRSKVTDDAASSAGEAVVPEPDHVSAPEQNHHAQAPGNADTQSVGVSESDMELERHKICEAKCVKLLEDVKQLEDEKNLWLQKEACLEEKIRLLQNEVEYCVQKEADLEEKLKDVQIGNDSFVHKQAILEDKVKHIEGIKDSWNLKEMSIKEMIARLDEVNVVLQMEVKELKESRDSLVQENQQLLESIPVLELRIQRIESGASFYESSTVNITEGGFGARLNSLDKFSEEKNLLDQMEAPHAPVNKLDAKNVELEKLAHELSNEKVNELYIDPDQHVVVGSSTAELDHVMAPVRAALPSDFASEHGEKIHSLERIHGAFSIHNGTVDFGADTRVQQRQLPELDESRISEDVVSVPLDDIRVQDADPSAMKSEEEDSAVPLSDAPMIGAPFRLISYFAKYVSGADLVNQNRSRSG